MRIPTDTVLFSKTVDINYCPMCGRKCVICRSRRQNKFKLKKLDSEKPKCITFMEVKK